jgi:hypothetical protein
VTRVPMAAGGNAMFTTPMDRYRASETPGALDVMARSPRTSLANTMPNHPTETMMCVASKSLYTRGDARRSPRLLRENKNINPPHRDRAACRTPALDLRRCTRPSRAPC